MLRYRQNTAVLQAAGLRHGQTGNLHLIAANATHSTATHHVFVAHIQHRVADHIVALLSGHYARDLAESIGQFLAAGGTQCIMAADLIWLNATFRIPQYQNGIICRFIDHIHDFLEAVPVIHPNCTQRPFADQSHHKFQVCPVFRLVPAIIDMTAHGHADFLSNGHFLNIQLFAFLHTIPSC